jgi:aspartate/methionine/tyrosine aminotransferase
MLDRSYRLGYRSGLCSIDRTDPELDSARARTVAVLPPIPYLEWIQGRPAAAAYDLGSSDLKPGSGGGHDSVVPARLEGLPDPPEGTTLETQLANEYGVSESQVLVTAGATHANVVAAMVAMGLSTGPRPQIVVERPGYQPLVTTPRGLGAEVDRFDRLRDRDYRLDHDALDAVTTRSFVLATVTNRHNPSGALAAREDLEPLAAVAAERSGYLLVDEVYAPYVTTSAHGASAFGGPTAVGLPNVVVSSSLTKFHGLGGLRIGWLVGPDQFIDRARRVCRHLPDVAEPSRALARRALHNPQLVDQSRSLLERNANRLSSFVAATPGLRGQAFPECTFAFLSRASVDGDAVVAAADERGVLVVPGRFFDRPAGFRLSLGREPAAMADGLDALRAALEATT